MKFHGLMLLRDEEDVIAQCFDHLLTWIDGLYILDLGSTDATWDIVQDYARRDPRIVPFMHAPIVYNDNLRCMIFDKYRERFSPGDWVMKIDADEFYHVAPPKFVNERLRRGETAVYLQWYFFRLTSKEVEDYESGRISIAEDRKRPIEERRRYYKISEYAEPRIFRYRKTMQWPETVSFPYNAGYVARERIPIRHYPHRDPLQMERRFKLRSWMMKLDPLATGGHWKLEDWRKEVVDAAGVSASAQGLRQGLAGERGIDTGKLYYWEPGKSFVEKPMHGHLPIIGKRLLQRIVHSPVLSIVDGRRRGFSKHYTPGRIPEDTNALISIRPTS